METDLCWLNRYWLISICTSYDNLDSNLGMIRTPDHIDIQRRIGSFHTFLDKTKRGVTVSQTPRL